VASGTERAVARLAAKGLDRLSTPMLAVPDKRMEVSVCDAKVLALRVGTSETCGVYAFGGSSATFHFRPGAYRRRRSPSTQRGRGGETTGRAIVWAARLEQTGERRAHLGCSRLDRTRMGPAQGTQQHQREDEKEHEQKHMYVHEAFSWLEMSRRDRFLLRR
jgi:hypothetical protein